ncbi:CgeB family protein [Bacillus benzoevorans]|uniref:Spore maturation protein CgeB n=1 Tax=Bacillus benzoevorans TaxID=1456 RepID=A0A7X0HQS2_9BACI|nr:glycosyltransferase [Bacillus benzoevorans]MBB6445215.1 spore maturation protein CgeB [Bacillus benzoevorans]
MKILFITSGYDGIYEHFETWIVNELEKKHEVKVLQHKTNLNIFHSLINTFQPDAAITLVGFKLPIRLLNALQNSRIKTAIWFTEDPYYIDQTSMLAEYFNYIFTIDSAAMDFYKENGHKHVFQLSLATEPQIFQPKGIHETYRSDICMVGFPYPERITFIQYLLQNTNYQIQVVGKWKKALALFQRHPQLRIHEGWVEPSKVADFYNSASIVLNTHRPFNLKQNQNRLGIVGKNINNRTFDAAACAAFQLIEFKEELPKHFKEKQEIISFKNNQELLEKLNYYLVHENERQRIAENARKRVLLEHTFAKRLDKMIHIMTTTG